MFSSFKYSVFVMPIVHQKSMEEEKKEHVEKTGDLLKWVKEITRSLNKGSGERAEKTDFLKKQVLKHCFSVYNKQLHGPVMFDFCMSVVLLRSQLWLVNIISFLHTTS
uniref:Uncharacterized protein n=1 Tax=Micrurus paraensis TaxID=1970185 RepID=A0A2D4K6H7_9SAUR